jgi:hypothetical protein
MSMALEKEANLTIIPLEGGRSRAANQRLPGKL